MKRGRKDLASVSSSLIICSHGASWKCASTDWLQTTSTWTVRIQGGYFYVKLEVASRGSRSSKTNTWESDCDESMAILVGSIQNSCCTTISYRLLHVVNTYKRTSQELNNGDDQQNKRISLNFNPGGICEHRRTMIETCDAAARKQLFQLAGYSLRAIISVSGLYKNIEKYF